MTMWMLLSCSKQTSRGNGENRVVNLACQLTLAPDRLNTFTVLVATANHETMVKNTRTIFISYCAEVVKIRVK